MSDSIQKSIDWLENSCIEQESKKVVTKYWYDGAVQSDEFYEDQEWFSDITDPEFETYKLFNSPQECLDEAFNNAVAEVNHIGKLLKGLECK